MTKIRLMTTGGYNDLVCAVGRTVEATRYKNMWHVTSSELLKTPEGSNAGYLFGYNEVEVIHECKD